MQIEQDPWPQDPFRAPTVLGNLVRDIQACDDEFRTMLLLDLMQAAWPSEWAQSQ